MTVFGPDVSKWQEGLVPPEPHGIHFGIARATNGQAIDPTCVRVIKWCRDHKVPFAAYHFVYEISSHSAAAQANAFSSAVGGDKSITCMLDWEKDDDDNCHPGRPQVPKWNDVLAVAEAIRKLGYKVPLLYANYYYWKDTCGGPVLSGQGFDLVNAHYDNTKTGDAATIYAARGGDAGPGWNPYGGLTPVLWQFTDKATWGNKNLDMNAYRGDPAVLNKWFTIWKETTVATYPYAYGSTMLTMEQMEAKTTVKKLNPEFWRRYKALIEFAASCGVKLGVGTGWRVQPNPPPAGFAPPGNSNHEGFPADGVTGGAVAIDTVPSASWPWMELHVKAYGLRTFKYINNEPWHIQPAEIPAGRSYRKEPWKLATFALPTQPSAPKPPTTTPPPTTTTNWAVTLCNSLPTLIRGSQGIQVKRMQHFLAYAGTMSPTNMANFDGVFGSGTESALNRFLATGNKPQNGICDDMVWNWFMATGDGVPTLKKGATGGDVTRMQRMLAANGYMDPANQTNFDGQFGSGTESALKRFQSAKGLAADGICGQNSWTKLLK